MNGEIDPLDIRRLFVGDQSLLFLVEIAIRTSIIYAYAFGLLRLIGRRTVGQLSLVEILVIVALGSAVGDVMFYPDVPLLHAIAVVTVVVLLTAGLNRLIATVEFVENIAEGSPKRVLSNGVLDREGMREASLATEEMFEQLRLRGIANLGELRAAYVEQNGELSVFRAHPAHQPLGLAIEPPFDLGGPIPFTNEQRVLQSRSYACMRDGRVRWFEAGEEFQVCECGSTAWTVALAWSQPANSEPESLTSTRS